MNNRNMDNQEWEELKNHAKESFGFGLGFGLAQFLVTLILTIIGVTVVGSILLLLIASQ